MPACFKYEELYNGPCWDFLEWGTWENCPKCGAEIHGIGSITRLFTEHYGVQFNDINGFMDALLRFMEQMHEAKIVEPKGTKGEER